MIEQQLEERFRLAVADEPPLGFDPDDIVTRAARRQRNRRAVTSVVAAVAAVAAFAAVTNMVTTASYTDMPIQPASPQPPDLTCPNDDQGISDINVLLARKTAEHVPALPYNAEPIGMPIGMTIDAQRPGELCAVSATWPSVSGDRNSPSVGLLLQFVPDGAVTDLFTDRPAYVRTDEIKSPDGSVVSTYMKVNPAVQAIPLDGGMLSVLSAPVAVVVHQRADGSVIRAESDDLATASVEQLKALATDPDIAF